MSDDRSDSRGAAAPDSPLTEVLPAQTTILDAAPAAPSAARKVGRYELLEKLGEGAYGAVHRARDPMIERVVALKLVAAERGEEDAAAGKSSGASLFQREARAAGALHHPHIVTLYDVGEDGPWYYLAMEMIEGGTFAKEIAATGTVSFERAVEVGAAVAEALDFAHQRGVVHRDIKPANLMIAADGRVKVADFGIARIVSAGRATMTMGAIVGTPHYMSPEQIRGDEIDGRSDLYALGVVLYEAVTGKKPFAGDTLTALLSQILAAEPKAPRTVNPEVPEALGRVIEKAMAKDRDRRHARGSELAAALRATLPGPAATGTVAPSRSAPSRAPVAMLGIAALLAAGGATWFFTRAEPSAVDAGGDGAAAPAASGIVEFLSEPTGADVVIDGAIIGRTPYRKEIPAGQYEIELRKEGYYPEAATIRVTADTRTPVELQLTAIEERSS
jgi:hypothetical protein